MLSFKNSFLAILISFGLYNKTIAQVNTTDSLALVALYNSTNGDNWNNNTGWLIDPVSQWIGISITGNRVTGIQLGRQGLKGSLPDQLGNLSALRSLHLWANQITGTIPPSLWSLSNLQELNLQSNSLSGTIPPEIEGLDMIEYFSLNFNNFSGHLPQEIGTLTNLTSLYLTANQFTESIPSSIGSLTQLKILSLTQNNFIGNPFPIINNLIGLTELSISRNNFEGEIPAGLSSLLHLEVLELSNNNFSGEPLPIVYTFPDLKVLRIDDNNFHGEISAEFSSLVNLKILNMQSNNFVGEPLPILSAFKNLEWLSIGGNNLTGEIPSNFYDLVNLDILQLSGQFSGTISEDIGKLKKLEVLSLNAKFEGSIPQSISNLTNLYQLTLLSNFSGEIFPFLANLNRLQSLSLVDNNFEGEIPLQFYDLINLESINLENNNFTGDISDDILNFTKLFTFLISRNQFTRLPDLSSLSNLQNLAVSNNNLDFGDIEPSLNLFQFVNRYSPMKRFGVPIDTTLIAGQNFNLTYEVGGQNNSYQWYKDNQILEGEITNELNIQSSSTSVIGEYYLSVTNSLVTGLEIRSELTKITVDNIENPGTATDSLALVALYNATDGPNWTNNTNWLEGPLNSWYGVTEENQRVTFLRLEANQLSGEIPPELGALQNLRWLFLDRNQLNGILPKELGNLNSLTRMVLNNNQFNGGIPVEISDLQNLEYLVLYNNQLEGEIPSQLGNMNNLTQLWLFNNNFSGEIPVELSKLNKLTLLLLQNNMLSGEIPPELGDLSSLRNCDLKNNQLSGIVPFELGNLGQLTSLDLSSNNLVGNVPSEIGDLQSLVLVFFENNRFSGTLPIEIINLSKLEYLNIENNYITDLPNLTSLSNLIDFNVSKNPIGLDAIAKNISIPGFKYDSIYAIDEAIDTLIYANNPISLSFNAGGGGTQYQWFKDGVLQEDLTSSTYIIDSINRFNMGSYQIQASHPDVPDLTLSSETKTALAVADISGQLFIDETTEASESSNINLLQIKQGEAYDTIASLFTGTNGGYFFEKVLVDDYLLLGQVDTMIYPNAIPTYFENSVLWEEAETIKLNQNEENRNIVIQYKNVNSNGEGIISGTFSLETNTSNRKILQRISNAGIAVRRKINSGNRQEALFDLVTYVYTNQEGEFTVKNLPNNEYRLNIQYPGFPLDTLTDIDITINAQENNVNVEAIVNDGKIKIRRIQVTGIDNKEGLAISTYPNPTSGLLHISWANHLAGQNIQATIFNSSGKRLFMHELNDIDNALDVSALQEGMYFLTLSAPDYDFVRNVRFVVKYN